MSCDHKSESTRIADILRSRGFKNVRVEGYESYHIVVVEVCDDFYVFTSVSCSDSIYYYEFAVGDENFVIALEKVSCLDRAVEVVRKIYELVVPRQTDHPASS